MGGGNNVKAGQINEEAISVIQVKIIMLWSWWDEVTLWIYFQAKLEWFPDKLSMEIEGDFKNEFRAFDFRSKNQKAIYWDGQAYRRSNL